TVRTGYARVDAPIVPVPDRTIGMPDRTGAVPTAPGYDQPRTGPYPSRLTAGLFAVNGCTGPRYSPGHVGRHLLPRPLCAGGRADGRRGRAGTRREWRDRDPRRDALLPRRRWAAGRSRLAALGRGRPGRRAAPLDGDLGPQGRRRCRPRARAGRRPAHA